MASILVKHNQRVAYIGKTGSGKTYLAREVLAPIPRLIVIDAKHTLGGDDWNLEQGTQVIRRLKAGQPGRLRIPIIRPEEAIPAFNLAWQLRNVTVYIDEMVLTNPGTRPSFEMSRLYQVGREMGIGVQAATQRPRNVPPIMFSEADWIFLFRVSRAEDRKAVSDFGDEFESMREPIRDEHGFRVYTPTWRRSVYVKKYMSKHTERRKQDTSVDIGRKSA